MTGFRILYICTILCSVVLTSLISDVNAKTYKSSGRTSHSYPSSHGHSGSSGGHNAHSTSHSYPSHTSSGGGITHQNIHGSSGHSYPSSNSLSGGSSSSSRHSYPSSNSLSGGSGSKPSHGYPSSNSLSGTGSKPVSYPASPGLSGGTQYPAGVNRYPSGNSNPTGGSSYPHQTSGSNYPHHTNNHYNSNSWNAKPVTSHHSSVVHHHHYHYNYRPPTTIYYHSSNGLGPVSYPVYTGVLPPYVYEYRSSNNKYRYLLAGLALYNLGRMSSDPRMNSYHQHYVPQRDEHCRFGVRHSSGTAEEMAVDCRAITYFIYDMQTPQIQTQQISTNVVTTNIVQQNQSMLPNGTLIVPAAVNVQQQGVVVPNTQQIISSNGAIVSNPQQVNTVTTTTTQIMSVTDSKFSGAPVHLQNGMECYVSRSTTFSTIKKPVPCDLLQTYATQSLHRSSAIIIKFPLTLVLTAVAFLMYF